MGLGFESQPNHEIRDREVLTKGFPIVLLGAIDRIDFKSLSFLQKESPPLEFINGGLFD